jgi:hypothetical protein
VEESTTRTTNTTSKAPHPEIDPVELRHETSANRTRELRCSGRQPPMCFFSTIPQLRPWPASAQALAEEGDHAVPRRQRRMTGRVHEIDREH